MEVAYDCMLVAIDTWRVDHKQKTNKRVRNGCAKGRHVELLGYQMVLVMGGMFRLPPTRFRAIRRVSTCRCRAWYFCSHPTRLCSDETFAAARARVRVRGRDTPLVKSVPTISAVFVPFDVFIARRSHVRERHPRILQLTARYFSLIAHLVSERLC